MGSETEYWTALQKAVGERMRQAAEAAGLNAYTIAERMGVRPPTVYRWWRGARVSQERMAEYGAVVGRSPVWLYSGQEEPDWGKFFAEFFAHWGQALKAGEDPVQAYETAQRAMMGWTRPLDDDTQRIFNTPEIIAALRGAVREGTLPFFRGWTAEQRDWLARRLTFEDPRPPLVPVEECNHE